jgi:hypothetical protein
VGDLRAPEKPRRFTHARTSALSRRRELIATSDAMAGSHQSRVLKHGSFFSSRQIGKRIQENYGQII